MIIQSKAKVCLCLCVDDEKEIRFEDRGPVVLPAKWAVPAVLAFPDDIEVISSLNPGPGCEILFTSETGEVLRGMALLPKLTYQGASSFLVMVGETGRLVPTERIVGVNASPLFRLVSQAVDVMGTPEAKTMGADVIMALLGLDPEE